MLPQLWLFFFVLLLLLFCVCVCVCVFVFVFRLQPLMLQCCSVEDDATHDVTA